MERETGFEPATACLEGRNSSHYRAGPAQAVPGQIRLYCELDLNPIVILIQDEPCFTAWTSGEDIPLLIQKDERFVFLTNRTPTQTKLL